MDDRIAGLRTLVRERLASLGEGRRVAYVARPRPTRELELPRGFEPDSTPFGPAWKRFDFLSLPAGPAATEGCAYFDTETTGLSQGSGTLIFAAAVAHPAPSGIEIVQLFLPEPGGEPAFLHALRCELARAKLVATYNGLRFDMPILRNRFVMAGLDDLAHEPQTPHLDVLELARPLLRSSLGSCALRNVEVRFLDFAREEDIPSHLVPDAYFEYLRRGDRTALEAALAHNRQDVLSLFHLHARLAQRLAGREHALSALELLALGRYHLRQGRRAAGVRSLRQAIALRDPDASTTAALLLAALLVRRGSAATAERVLASLHQRVPQSARLAIARARILEWRVKDLPGALTVVDETLRRLPRVHPATRDLQHRRARLERRLWRARARAPA